MREYIQVKTNSQLTSKDTGLITSKIWEEFKLDFGYSWQGQIP